MMVARVVTAGLLATMLVAATPSQERRTEGVALLERATELHAKAKYAEAIAAYDRATAKLPQIADWISVFAASSASFMGDTAQVARRLSGVDEEMAQWAWRARARAFEKAGAKSRALQVAREATRSDRISARSDAWYMIADLGAPLTARERVEAGRAHMRNGNVSVGVRELGRALDSGQLDAAESGEVRYELGRVLFSTGKYAPAEAHLERVPRDHARAADARFLLGRVYYRTKRADEGQHIFRGVAADYSDQPAATRALFFLGDLAHDAGNTEQAAKFFDETAKAIAKTNETALAMMRAGSIAFQQKDYAKASRVFEEYRARYPNGAYIGQATYWAAQSAANSGNNPKANELYRSVRAAAPVSYYALRAARQLGDTALLAGLPEGPTTDAALRKDVVAVVDRWDLLRKVGWNEAASFELARIRKRYEGEQSAIYAVAEDLEKRGAPHLAITIGRDLITSGSKWDARLVRIMYPLPYERTIKTEARKRGLNPYFVAALIRQESRFNTDARSGAGAIGLMQVMPATGRALGKKLGVKKVTEASLTQPTLNIKLGTEFLSDLVTMYPGRPDLALVAYNAGPSRAYRWRQLPEYPSQDLFIERIPFDETREYVKVVTLNTAIYKALFPSPAAGD